MRADQKGPGVRPKIGAVHASKYPLVSLSNRTPPRRGLSRGGSLFALRPSPACEFVPQALPGWSLLASRSHLLLFVVISSKTADSKRPHLKVVEDF